MATPQDLALYGHPRASGTPPYWRTYLALAVPLCLLTWSPLIKPYIPIDDDYLLPSNAENWGQLGVWRYFGFKLGSSLLQAGGVWPYSALMLCHFTVATTLGRIALSLACHPTDAIAISLLFLTYPFAYGVLTWLTILQLVAATALATTVFLLADAVRPVVLGRRSSPMSSFLLLSACSVLTLMTQENLAFIVAAYSLYFVFLIDTPTISALLSKPILLLRLRAGWPLMGPAVGVVIYMCLYKITAVSPHNPPRPNPESLVSTYVYQYTHIWNFEPLFAPDLYALAFFEWGIAHMVAVVLSISLLIMTRAIGNQRDVAAHCSKASSGRFSTQATGAGVRLLFALVLLASGSLVFAISGGYSLDFHKKYPVAVGVVLAVVSVLPNLHRRALSGISTNATCRAALHTVFWLIIASNVVTAWLQIGYWRYRSRAQLEELISIEKNGYVLPASQEYSISLSDWSHADVLFEGLRFRERGVEIGLGCRNPDFEASWLKQGSYKMFFDGHHWRSDFEAPAR